MFLTEDDYRVVTCPADLAIICQSSDEIRQQAERTAMEEISSYIRGRYNVDYAFSRVGSERNPLLVQLTVSIAIFWMSQWLPAQREAYVTIYNAAIDRLRAVQKGDVSLEISKPSGDPSAPDGDDDSQESSGSFGFSFGSLPRNRFPPY